MLQLVKCEFGRATLTYLGKQVCLTCPKRILAASNFSRLFKLEVDASTSGASDECQKVMKRFSANQVNYSMIEKRMKESRF